MSANRSKPRWRDGRIDPDWLAEAGLSFVQGWLRNRLEGKDIHQPIDHRIDEDPEAFVVRLLRDVGPLHEAFTVIASALLGLLDDARRRAPKEAPYLGRLLRVCQLVPLPKVQAWFDEEITTIDGPIPHWTVETCQSIVCAAITQRAGSESDWLRLLRVPAYTTWAFLALGPNWAARIKYLGVWWEAADDAERRRELDQILRSMLREHGVTEMVTMLDAQLALPETLRTAIGLALHSQGHANASPQLHRTSAISGAGLKREYVLHHAGAA